MDDTNTRWKPQNLIYPDHLTNLCWLAPADTLRAPSEALLAPDDPLGVLVSPIAPPDKLLITY